MLRYKSRLHVVQINLLHAQEIFTLQESRSDVYFLQHENLLRAYVVIRATSGCNLQTATDNIVAQQVHFVARITSP